MKKNSRENPDNRADIYGLPKNRGESVCGGG